MPSEKAATLKDFSAVVSRDSLTLTSSNGEVETLPIVQATDDHRNFILSTWVRSYEAFARRLSVGPAHQRMSTEAYRRGEARVAERHWQKTRCVVSGSDHYTIHAWVCGEHGEDEAPGKLWHVYVSPVLRRKGVGAGLVQDVCGVRFESHKALPHKDFTRECIWNPYMDMDWPRVD